MPGVTLRGGRDLADECCINSGGSNGSGPRLAREMAITCGGSAAVVVWWHGGGEGARKPSPVRSGTPEVAAFTRGRRLVAIRGELQRAQRKLPRDRNSHQACADTFRPVRSP